MASRNEDGGYVRIYRRLLTHPMFRSPAEALAFAYLICQAQWQDREYRLKGRTYQLKRGQVVMSVRDFAEAMERSKDWAKRFLDRLENEGMIARQHRDSDRDSGATVGATVTTIVSICNYDEYQGDRGDAATATARQPRQQLFQTATQNNKEKKGKEGKDNPQTPLPDWVPVDAWEGWLEMRKRKGIPNTGRALTIALKTLGDLKRRGFDPTKVLDTATVRGWRGLYEPTGKDAGELRAQQPLTI